MAKHLNTINLAFTADTSQAKHALQDLQNQLHKITTGTKIGTGIEEDIRGAIHAATELSVHLKKATNLETGNLDFSKFNQSIKQSGMSLQQYGAQLQKLGPQGQQAFMSLAQSVSTAEIPIKRSNAMLKELGVTLANTARWQLSSSILHGFMSSMQSAYGYAQDLNESLNNIRIVTGQSIDQMAKFAQEANKAARALSATTTEYTNASLIYYQQGLNDQQVKERTDITIKMANVARQSAEVVSDQMTAVWNNFYDGSKSLEYYADAMTALGAATASSTDEIAGGLEKFAAIGETIGLSFDYAAAALATITSNTRQSEEVVGTALKTIFARIQGLKLGESLEDGTDLNKYSEALQKVGISIFDQTGELKAMDNILDEMASKWGTLSKAQQAALAQTVAGVRQYTQLVALMENWNNGDNDSMVANLTTVSSSAGALQEQADIYAESWEGARDRVTAAAEAIYSSLIEDEAFIDLLGGIEKVLSFVNDLIDRLGGLKGTLLAIGAIITKVFSTQLSAGLTNMAYNLKMMTKSGRDQVVKDQRAFIDDAANSIQQNPDFTSDTEQAQQDSMRSQLTLQQEYMNNASNMNGIESEVNRKMMDRVRLLKEAVVESERLKEQAAQSADAAKMDIITDIESHNLRNPENTINIDEVHSYMSTISKATKMQEILESSGQIAFEAISTKSKDADSSVKTFISELKKVKFTAEEVGGTDAFNKLQQKIKNVTGAQGPEQLEQAIKELNYELEILSKNSNFSLKDLVSPAEAKKVDQYTESLRKKASAQRDSARAAREAAAAEETTIQRMRNATGVQKTWSDLMVDGAQLAMNTAMAFQMLGSTMDTLKDPNVSGWEKFLSVLMTLGMTIPMLMSSWTALKSLISAETVVKIANALATLGQAAAEKKLNKEKQGSRKLTKDSIKDTIQDTKNKVKGGAKDRAQSFKDSWTKKVLDKKYGGNAEKWANGAWHTGKGANNGGKLIKGADAANLAKGAAKSLGTSALSVAAIAAGIAVIAGGIAWGIKQANKAEEAIEKAKERVKELESNLETVKSSYSEFQSNVSAFESASKGIEGLTKGTKEYSKAVFEANQAAMKLIESNKDLKYSVKDGIITFDEGELDRVLEEQQNAVTKATAAKALGDQAVQKAEQNKKVRDYAREIDSKSDNGQNAGNIAGAVGTGLTGGALIGAGIGGLVGGSATVGVLTLPAAALGAIIGGAIGAVGGLITGLVGVNTTGSAVDAETQAIEKLAAAYQLDSSILAKSETELKEYLSKSVEEGGLGLDDEKLVNALAENSDETRALIEEMVRNTEAINAQNDQIAAQVLGDEEFIQQSEYGDAIIDRAGNAYGNMVNEILNSEAMQQWGADGISKASGANDEAKDIFEEYLKAAGLDNQGYKLKDTKGTDKNREFVYLDADGNEKTVSLDTMRYTMASAQALEHLEQIAAEMALDIHKWASDETPTSQALLSFLTTGAFGDATKSEYDAINTAVTTAGGFEEYLKQIFGDDLAETAERYGYGSIDEFVKAFETALANGAKEWENIKIPGIGDKGKENLKLSDAKSFESTVDFMNTNTAEGAGEQAGEKFLSGLTSVIENLDPKDQEEAWSKVAQIDWTKFNAGYEVIDILDDLGYTLSEDTLPAFEQWVSDTNAATLATYDFGAAMQEIEKANEIAEDMEIGKIISKEDYDALMEYNKELEKYFDLLATGEARFIGDKLDFQQDLEDTEQKKYKDAITNTQQSYQNVLDRKKRQDQAEEYGGYDVLSVKAGTVSSKTVQTHEDATFLDKAWARISAAAYGSSGAQSYSDAYNNALDKATSTTDTVEVFTRNAELYKNQIAFLQEIGADLDGINTDSSTYTKDDAKAVVEKIKQYSEQSVSQEELDQALAAMTQSQLEYARTAEDPAEREAMVEEGLISEDVAAAAATEAHQSEKWEGMDAEEVEEYADSIMEAAKASSLLSDELKDNEEAAEDVALYTKKMNQGIDKLADGFEDWSGVLKKSDKGSEEYSSAMKNMKDAMSDVLGVSEDFLSDDFIVKNMKDIELAAQGNAEAIDRLAIAAGRDIITHMEIEGGEEVKNEVLALHDQLAAEIPNIEVGATLDSGDFLMKAAQVVETAQMSVEEANAYFRSMGFEANFATKKVPITQELKGVRTTTKIVKWGIGALAGHPEEIIQTSEEVPMGTKTEMMEVPALTTDGGEPNFTLTRTNAGAMNNYSSSNSGGKGPGSGSKGGGSEPKKTSEARGKKTDLVDRYKEINDQLEKTQRLMNKVDIAAEGLWGPKQIAKMKESAKLMEQENKQLQQKYELSKKYLEEDTAALNKAASDVGLSFTYEDGAITNYTEQMTALFNQREALLDSFGATMDEQEEERLAEFDKKVDALKEAYEQYETTLDEKQDMEEEHLQKMLEIQQKYYEILTKELEVKISLDDDALETLDYYLNKTQDDFFDRAEAASIMLNQGEINQSKLQTYAEHKEKLDEQYTTINPETGETYINQQQYIEGLRETKTSILGELQALNELDKSMMHYYGETLEAAGAEIDELTDRMAHQTAVLDHYQNLLDIMGKETDYAKKGTVLAGKAKTIGNEYKAAQKEYEMYAEEADKKYRAMMNATSEAEKEMYKQQYEDALRMRDQAHDEYLSKAEEYAESLRAILENNLNQYAQTLENTLTRGYGSFDQMNAAMERANSLQEEYLTTTNKIYETNKLMNQAQQEIDKTSNTIAKQRLKQFINETNQLQEKNKLSKFELEIQQAKYDLLLAEIALEEAQEAKSTVRLQRDSEGNFGYVYTADQDKIADAQQKLADAQNDLYNIALEGANGYAEKYQQTLNEMYDTLTDLQQQYLNGAFESEAEYQQAVMAAKEYYFAKLEEYSGLHAIALSTDSRVIEEAWSRELNTMIYDTDKWQRAVNEYVGLATAAFRQWDREMDTIAGELGLGKDFNQLGTAVNNVTQESKALLTELTKPDGLLDNLQEEIDKVSEVTAEYGKKRTAILETIDAYEDLIEVIDAKLAAEGKENEDEDGNNNNNNNNNGNNNNGNSNNDNNGNKPELKIGSSVQVKSGRKWYYDSYGTAPTGTARSGTILYMNSKGSHPYNIDGLGWIKKEDIVGYDTGGYTGEWGSYGKMAWLHEKELILNAQDTKNLLDSMEFLDNIIKTIDLQTMNSQLGGLLKSPSFGNLLQQQQTLEQNVKIEASFPNVQNKTEIEEAFETLVNRASQYANRK